MGFWKNLGKIASIAAPIVAAPFTGGTSLALIGAGAGAAHGALSGKGLKGSLLEAGLGAVPGLGKATMAKGAVDAGGKAVSGGGLVSGLLSGGKKILTDQAEQQSGKLLSKLLSGDTMDAAGKGVAGIAQTEAHNRGTKLDAEMEADKMKALVDQYNRQSADDGLKQMQIASYLKEGGYKPVANPVLHSGLTATKFDFGTRPASADEQAYASRMVDQLNDRQAHPLTVSDYSKLMDPGKLERTMDFLGPILTTVGAAKGAGKYVPPYNAGMRQPTNPALPGQTTSAPVAPTAPAADTQVTLPPVQFNIPTTKRNPYDVEF